MKLYLIIFFSMCFCKSQDYSLTFFGFHIGDIKQSIFEEGKIKYEVKSRGIMDLFYPLENNYYAYFDTKTFNLKSWGKKIKQGSYKSSLDAKIDSFETTLQYKNKAIQIEGAVHTIFTMLAMAQFLPFEILDTKWYSYEHQGNIGKTRLLWSDSLMVLEGKDSVMCDHYRLDIKIIDSTFAIRESEDYFMTNLLNDDYIKEIWVKRGNNRKIVQASFKNEWISFIAKANQ